MTTYIKATESEDFHGKSDSSDPKKREQAEYIYLVKGLDAGREAWYYVLVDKKKIKQFLKELEADIIHLEDFGVVLYSAYGMEPPKEIIDAIHIEYGI